MYKKTIRLNFPDLKLPLMILGNLIVVFTIMELLLYNPWVVSNVPAPSPGLSYSFPEVGVKFRRYFQKGDINCLFFGSSIVDAGLDPETIEKKGSKINPTNLDCFNFGLSGAMVETSSKFSRMLVDWQPTNMVIIGVSPIEFDLMEKESRKLDDLLIFSIDNKQTLHGWFFNTFRLPWFIAGLFNKKDNDFQEDEISWEKLINANGVRVSNEVVTRVIIPGQYRLPNYTINDADLHALDDMIKNLKKKGVEIHVIEMPVKPSYFPWLIEGGNTIYESQYISPVQEVLYSHNMSLIRTQKNIEEILDDSDWYNETHLNYRGAKKFSSFIATLIN